MSISDRACGVEVFGETFRTLAITSSLGLTSLNPSINQSVWAVCSEPATPLKFRVNRKKAAV